jgi:hypothetical protein
VQGTGKCGSCAVERMLFSNGLRRTLPHQLLQLLLAATDRRKVCAHGRLQSSAVGSL